MRNVHGICPECHSRISIDLDAAVVECPICHRRLKTKKTNNPDVAKAPAPAAQGVSMPAGMEHDAAARQTVETPAAFSDPTPAEPVPVSIPSDVELPDEMPKDVDLPEETPAPAEEPIPEEAPAPEAEPAPAEEPTPEPEPEEDAMTEEEAMALAASLDEDSIPAAETSAEESPEAEAAAEEEAPSEEIDADEISAEELALMDDVPPAMSTEASDETIVYSSVSDEDDTPAPDEDEAEEPAEEEEALGDGMKELSADTEGSDLAVEDAAEEPAPEEIAAPEEPASEEDDDFTIEEAPAVEDAPAPAEETPADETPADAAPAEEAGEAEANEGPAVETPVAEEPTVEEPAGEESAPAEPVAEAPAAEAAEEPTAPVLAPAPVEEAPAAETAAADETEGLAYSEEDFAAAGEIDVRTADVRTFRAPKHPPVVVRSAPAKQPEQSTTQTKQAQGNIPTPSSPADHTRIYAKPVAIILAVLSLLFVLVELTYGLFVRSTEYAGVFLSGNLEGAVYAEAPALIAALPADILSKVLGFLPVFGGDNFRLIITAVYYGILALIAIFGITGKRGKVGSILLLLAVVVLGMPRIWALNGDKFFFIPYEGISDILVKYHHFILAGGYLLLVLAGVFYVVGFSRAKETYSFSFWAGFIALLFGLIVLLGGAALIVGSVLKKLPDILVTYFGYGLLGGFGITVLLTLIGVHRADLSRSANGYLAAYELIAFGFLAALAAVLPRYIDADFNLISRFVGAMTSALAIGAAGFAFADLRN